MAKQRKIPLRMCIGCHTMKPKKEMLRIVKNKEGEISIDFKGKKPGRGAYICNDISCFNQVRKSKKLEKTFEQRIDEDIYKQLEEELEVQKDE